MKKNGWFVVQGGKTKRKYVIHTRAGAAGNITELDKEHRASRRACCHVPYDYGIPPFDQFLAQKLWLEYDENHFLARANMSVANGCEYREAA